MKTFSKLSMLLMILSIAAMTSNVFAQSPGRGGGPGGFGGRGGGGGMQGRGGGGMMERMMQMMPVFAALDANGDGTLSESEIKNASAALMKLDKNNDKKLDSQEMAPDMQGMRGGGRGGPGGGGQGGFGGGRGGPGGGGQGGFGGGRGGPGGGGQGGFGGGRGGRGGNNSNDGPVRPKRPQLEDE